MSLSRPARCLLSRCPFSLAPPTAVTVAPPHHHGFSTSVPRRSRRPRFRNITAEKMGLIPGSKKLQDKGEEMWPEYTKADRQVLRKKYTPAQFEAIAAAEREIPTSHLVLQGRLRDDPYRPGYLDDLAMVQPVIDLPKENTTPSEPVRFLEADEWIDDFMDRMTKKVEKRVESTLAGSMARALRKVKESEGNLIDVTEEELRQLEQDPVAAERLMEMKVARQHAARLAAPNTGDQQQQQQQQPVGPGRNDLTEDELKRLSKRIDKEFFEELENMFNGDANPLLGSKIDEWKEVDESGDRRTSALAADIRRIPGLESLYARAGQDDASNEDHPEFARRLQRVTGIELADTRRLMIKDLHSRFVSNQTRLGKIPSMRIVTIAGNGDGWLGLGIAKSVTVETAMMMSRLLAIRNMKPIRRYENRTIYGDVEVKISGTVVRLHARPPGFGLRVSHRLFEMCRAVGIHDIAGSIPRSRNPMNSVKAAYAALLNQPDPEMIARGRGRKLVDVRKVYYGGNVY